jgi:hypothetical protein
MYTYIFRQDAWDPRQHCAALLSVRSRFGGDGNQHTPCKPGRQNARKGCLSSSHFAALSHVQVHLLSVGLCDCSVFAVMFAVAKRCNKTAPKAYKKEVIPQAHKPVHEIKTKTPFKHQGS